MTRIVVVGGRGGFGARLVEQLRAQAFCTVIVAGRAAENDVQLDRQKVRPEDLAAHNPTIVVDAAGPFQGQDYTLARAAIGAGAHYLDIADARDFIVGFPALDTLAREHGVQARAGASSTPALSAAAVRALTHGWRRIHTIRTIIAPAGDAPRGRSLVAAILSWAGAPLVAFIGGAWIKQRGWRDEGVWDVPGIGKRRAALADTADLELYPEQFKVLESVQFFAGLPDPIMHHGMRAIALLRRWGGWRQPQKAAAFLHWAAKLLPQNKSAIGGMCVEVTGRNALNEAECARWVLLAPPGLGPTTPILPALALCRRWAQAPPTRPGAAACLDDVSLEDLSPDFHRLGFKAQLERQALQSPLQRAASGDYEALPAPVRRFHSDGPVVRARGEAKVEGPSNWLSALVARIFGFPEEARRTPVEVIIRTRSDGAELWQRRIGKARFRSTLRYLASGRVEERFGLIRCTLELSASAAGLTLNVVGWRLGPVPMPAVLAPRSRAFESQDSFGRFTFDVPIALPILGRLTRYSGWLEIERVDG